MTPALLLLLPLTLSGAVLPAVAAESARAIPSPGAAAQDGKLDAAAAKRVDFRSVLERLSQRTRCAVLAEGWPLEDEIDPATLPPVYHAGKETMRPADMAKIAELFDYTLESRRNVLLLRKRYSSPADLPVISIEEARDALRDVQTVIAPFSLNFKSVGVTSDPEVRRLLRSLTPEQRAAMADKRKGLAVGDMTSAQRAGTWRAALYFYTGEAERALRAARHHLASAAEDELYFGWPTPPSPRAFGYGFPAPGGAAAAAAGDIFRPLTHKDGGVSLEGHTISTAGMSSGPSGTSGAPEMGKKRDAARRDPARTAAAAQVSTLREQVDAMNARSSAARSSAARSGEHAGAVRTVVDDSLAAKPVCLVGAKYAAQSEVLRGAADLFGLRLVKILGKEGQPPQQQRLTRHKARPAQRLEDIRGDVLDALPAPFLRAFFAISPRSVDPGDTTPGVFDFHPVTGRPSSILSDKHRTAMRAVAARRLRDAFDAALAKQERADRVANADRAAGGSRAAPAERVKIGRFDPQARSDFAVMLMNDCLAEMTQLLGPTPWHVSEFDSVVLTGFIQNIAASKRMIYVSFCRRTAEGALEQEGPIFSSVLDSDPAN